MEVEKLGEINVDGRIIDLDEAPVKTCEEELKKIRKQKKEVIIQINKVLEKI